jgi:hypothetical protein
VVQGPKLRTSILQTTLASLVVSVLSIGAHGQEPFSVRMLRLPATGNQGAAYASNFQLPDFRFETLDENSPASPDTAPDTSPSKSQPGLVKRNVKRIGEDQRRLYLAPFERHNLKWDALVLVGTGAFLAADRHIENNISHSNISAYQTTSDIAIAGLAASLGGDIRLRIQRRT